MVDAFVYRQAISKAIYEDEIARLDEEITVAQIEANEAEIDHLDWESVFRFAEHVLTHADRLWLEFDLDKEAAAPARPFSKRVALYEWRI